MAIRLRIALNIHFNDRGLTQPTEVGTVVGLPASQPVRLLNRRQYRKGTIKTRQCVADHLGLAPLPISRPARPALAGAGGHKNQYADLRPDLIAQRFSA